MTSSEFKLFTAGLLAFCEEEMAKKEKEYNREPNDGDRFAHFKRLAAETRSTPMGVAYVLYRKQLDAILSYIQSGGRVFSNEPIEKRFVDLINYSFLMAGMAAEIEDQIRVEQMGESEREEHWHAAIRENN